MQTVSWILKDKSTWGDGPWHKEPDKVQWEDAATGLPNLAVRGPVRAWCGYVGVPSGHALYGVGYSDVEDSFLVHGGLTFSGVCDEEHPDKICHVPDSGEEKNVWWFGFDCAHAGDMVPRLWDDGEYRTLGYVKEQCRLLAAQLKVYVV